jgi:hypothetical protein
MLHARPLSLAALALALCAPGCEDPHAGDAAALAALERGLPRAECPALDRALASKLVRLSIACADREYPNKPGSVLDSDGDVRPPRDRTPSFFGCFDWHSSVHGHFTLARVLSTFPDLPEARAIRELLDRHLTSARIAAEVAHLSREENRTFERPYGWAWLLRLRAELAHASASDPDARRWADAVAPLASLVSKKMIAYLSALSVPVRDGTHQNTAFALAHAFDYARATADAPLEAAIRRRARDFYAGDISCPTAYEPSGEDFVSPCFAEADLLRRVLDPAAFRAFYDRFMPAPTSPSFRSLLGPVLARDPKDPRIGHLIGLSLQRAWSMRGVARALAPSDPRRRILLAIAARHCASALDLMGAAGYGGEHWLATFAVYLLTESGGKS